MDKNEIEVTPAMLKAAADAITPEEQYTDGIGSNVEQFATRLYRAMESARRETSERSQPRD